MVERLANVGASAGALMNSALVPVPPSTQSPCYNSAGCGSPGSGENSIVLAGMDAHSGQGYLQDARERAVFDTGSTRARLARTALTEIFDPLSQPCRSSSRRCCVSRTQLRLIRRLAREQGLRGCSSRRIQPLHVAVARIHNRTRVPASSSRSRARYITQHERAGITTSNEFAAHHQVATSTAAMNTEESS